MEKEYAFDQTIVNLTRLVDSNYERHMGGRAHRFVGRRLRLKEPTLEARLKDYGYKPLPVVLDQASNRGLITFAGPARWSDRRHRLAAGWAGE